MPTSGQAAAAGAANSAALQQEYVGLRKQGYSHDEARKILFAKYMDQKPVGGDPAGLSTVESIIKYLNHYLHLPLPDVRPLPLYGEGSQKQSDPSVTKP